jgi:hypothetical protein
MKQTAIEWLVEYLKLHGIELNNDAIHNVINQAKEMEKEQIKKAWSDRVTKDYQFIRIDQKSAEQYFIENFKSE